MRLRSFKLEDDSDIHLVRHQGGDDVAAKMLRARRALIAACGTPVTGSFRSLNGSATITGVAFFDVIHGQTGVAPNGIELHPVLGFNGACH